VRSDFHCISCGCIESPLPRAMASERFGRAALGARGNLRGLVLRSGMWRTGIGLVIGFAGALALLTSLLFGVGERDPGTIAAVAVLLASVALLPWLYSRAARDTRRSDGRSSVTNNELAIEPHRQPELCPPHWHKTGVRFTLPTRATVSPVGADLPRSRNQEHPGSPDRRGWRVVYSKANLF
jgi:hypothetical protein